VYGHYYAVPLLAVVNYASVVLAAIFFVVILTKFYRYEKRLALAAAKAALG